MTKTSPMSQRRVPCFAYLFFTTQFVLQIYHSKTFYFSLCFLSIKNTDDFFDVVKFVFRQKRCRFCKNVLFVFSKTKNAIFNPNIPFFQQKRLQNPVGFAAFYTV